MTTRRALWRQLCWKAWRESRARFVVALALVFSLVAFTVLSGADFLAGLAIHHPDARTTYTGYIWLSLFDFYLQGVWIGCAILLGLGGVWRERATGVANFTLSLPVTRNDLLITRTIVAVAEAFVIAFVPCLSISLFARLTGFVYPVNQALLFAFLLAVGGSAFLALSLLLSSVFDGEFTALLLGLTLAGVAFFVFKAEALERWSIFDVMSGARHIDPTTHLLGRSLPWAGLSISVLSAWAMIAGANRLLSVSDF